LAVSACSQGEAPGDDWKFDGGVPDARQDSSQDMGQDADPSPEPVETTLWLENDTDKTLYVQEASNCRISPPSWIDWRSGGRAVDYCAICNCERIESGEGCQACPEACAVDQVQAVEPGARVEWTWSGYVWRDDQVDQQACERRSIPERGEQMRAELCWGDSYSGSGSPGESTGTVDDPECTEVSFAYGTSEAGHTVQDDPADKGPPTLELTNESAREVRVLTLSDCGTDQREWISVRRESPRQVELDWLKLRSSCAECQCSSVNDKGQCIVCGKACDRREIETLSAGETRTYDWDGLAWRSGERNGRQCVERVEMWNGKELEARFCWTNQTDGDFDILDLVCEEVEFTFGRVETVSHTIQ
jgi:hypothetical protein